MPGAAAVPAAWSRPPVGGARSAGYHSHRATIWCDEICLTGRQAFVPLPVSAPPSHPYGPQDQHVIECLLEGREPLVNAVEGARSAAAVLVVKDAVRQGRPVPIPSLG